MVMQEARMDDIDPDHIRWIIARAKPWVKLGPRTVFGDGRVACGGRHYQDDALKPFIGQQVFVLPEVYPAIAIYTAYWVEGVYHRIGVPNRFICSIGTPVPASECL
jgi:hypothetical protein